MNITPAQERTFARFAKLFEREILMPKDETAALATLFLWIGQGRKQENLWGQAVAVDYLVKLYGSRSAVAKKVGCSVEQIRQRHILLDLPPDIRMMFA